MPFPFMKHFPEVVHYTILPTTSTHVPWSELAHMAALGSRQPGYVGSHLGSYSQLQPVLTGLCYRGKERTNIEGPLAVVFGSSAI